MSTSNKFKISFVFYRKQSNWHWKSSSQKEMDMNYFYYTKFCSIHLPKLKVLNNTLKTPNLCKKNQYSHLHTYTKLCVLYEARRLKNKTWKVITGKSLHSNKFINFVVRLTHISKKSFNLCQLTTILFFSLFSLQSRRMKFLLRRYRKTYLEL